MFVVDVKGIYDAMSETEYILYWQDKEKEINDDIKQINEVHLTENHVKELKKIVEFKNIITEFIAAIKDRKNPKLSEVTKAIRKRINETNKGKDNSKLTDSVAPNKSVFDNLLVPTNQRFIKIFGEFMNDELLEATRSQNIRKYAEGLVDLFLKNIIIINLNVTNDDYALLNWYDKIKVISDCYSETFANKLKDITEVSNKAEDFWNDIDKVELHRIVNIVNRLVDDIFVEYFCSDKHEFGKENIYCYFSMLPLHNRIYILEKVYNRIRNMAVVDRLTLAYVKNGERDKAEEFMDKAVKEGVISDDFVKWQTEKFDALSNALTCVQEQNKNIENFDGNVYGRWCGTQLVIGFPSSNNVFDVEKAYSILHSTEKDMKKQYPDFMNMFLMLLPRDMREY